MNPLPETHDAYASVEQAARLDESSLLFSTRYNATTEQRTIPQKCEGNFELHRSRRPFWEQARQPVSSQPRGFMLAARRHIVATISKSDTYLEVGCRIEVPTDPSIEPQTCTVYTSTAQVQYNPGALGFPTLDPNIPEKDEQDE